MTVGSTLCIKRTEPQERSADVMRSSWLIYMVLLLWRVILGSSTRQRALCRRVFHFIRSLPCSYATIWWHLTTTLSRFVVGVGQDSSVLSRIVLGIPLNPLWFNSMVVTLNEDRSAYCTSRWWLCSSSFAFLLLYQHPFQLMNVLCTWCLSLEGSVLFECVSLASCSAEPEL